MASELMALPTLRVRLLGGFGVGRDGDGAEVSDWQRRSAKTLTKLLATHPSHALHREQILDTLWPGADLESALNSFGKALHAARRAIEPELVRRQSSAYLRLQDAMLALEMEHVAIDADRFEQLAQNALRSTDAHALESALAAYGGELLPEDRYEDWCAERRGYLIELHIRVLLALAEAFERSGAYNEAADRLREVLQKDQTREEVHRRLMRLYAGMGTPDQAVRQFHRCQEVLRRELDLTPQHETVLLFQDILASRIPQREAAQALLATGNGLGGGPAADNATDRQFVGRGPVLQYLCQQLTRRNPGPGMVLISGEAGVGKTRLLEELAGEAGRRGAAVLWGGSGAHAQQFAWGPFAVALEGYAASRPETGRSELAAHYPPLARFVPSLGLQQGPVLAVSGASDPQLDLIPAIVRLLTDLARSQPVLLVLGDLHEADPFSLDLLRYLAQLALKRPWLIVGAARPEELDADTELGRMLQAATRERLCEQIELGCLCRRDCDELVRVIDPGGTAGPELAAQIYQRSRGNPLFVEEFVREMRESSASRGGQEKPAEVTERVQAHVRALVTARLARMDETVRRVLMLAAAAPTAEIPLGKLRTGAAALDPPVSGAALFDALDRALQMGLLEERAQGYAFRHPLVRSALYEGLSRHRRDQFEAALTVAR
jgi:DNA-binding SARP family transcriptional activator